jgi:predicted ATPase/DNA-binding CsgD family transcriptional regulator
MSRASPSEHSPALTPFPGQRRGASTLPTPLTPLLGRDDDIVQIRALLDGDETRLVTLTGPGGVGKTRLAIAVATLLEPEFAHGAVFVPLASVRDANLVPLAVGQALGIQEQGDRAMPELLIGVLREQHLLLVLDNLEHIVDFVATWLTELLSRCPRLKVLATSRIALSIDGEQRYLVAPLPLPDAESFEAVSGNAAVRLFAQRAHAVRQDFALSETNAGIVTAIVRQLDGVPLAIELAAARTTVLSPAAILARLTDRLGVLTGGRRDAPARHRTMRAAIAWSYDLLSPEDQAVFRRLAVFVGGFTLEAAEAVGGDEAIDRLGALIDHSLVRHVAMPKGEPRLWMLETIREYGLEQLAADGDDAAARDAHAAYCLYVTRCAWDAMEGSGQVRWYDRLEAEQGNQRAACAWLVERERIEEAIDLTMNQIVFFGLRGHVTEARAQFEALLAHPRTAERTIARAKALHGAGSMAIKLGDRQRGQALLTEALAIFRERGDRLFTAVALLILGVAEDDIDRAMALTTEVYSIGREVGSNFLTGAGLINQSVLAQIRGDLDTAQALREEALALSRTVGDAYGIELGLLDLAELFLLRGEHERAEPLIQEGLRLSIELGDKHDWPYGQMLLARVYRARGEYAAAAACIEDGLPVARHTGDIETERDLLLALGDIATLQGDHANAIRMFREGIGLFHTIGDRFPVVRGFDGVARVAIATGDMRQAARLLGAADALLVDIGASRPEGPALTDHEDRIATVRSALGAAFNESFAAGMALSRDDAIAEAIAFEPISREEAGASAPAVPAAAMGLTPRELEVLRLMSDGLTNQEIADTLFVSLRTPTSHATSILTKLELPSRTAAVAYAIRNGLA